VFFHGYYDCYCYLPLYVFCGRHLLDAKLRRASVDVADGTVEAVARVIAQIRRRWPKVRVLVRADSGFARDDLMACCEANGVHFLLGLAQNERLNAMIARELGQAEAKSRRTGKPARYFKDFCWQTRRNWNRERRGLARSLERHAGGPSAEEVVRDEVHHSHLYGGRSVFGLEPAPRDSDKEQDPGIQMVSRSARSIPQRGEHVPALADQTEGKALSTGRQAAWQSEPMCQAELARDPLRPPSSTSRCRQ
jgi:hypothetical protein